MKNLLANTLMVAMMPFFAVGFVFGVIEAAFMTARMVAHGLLEKVAAQQLGRE